MGRISPRRALRTSPGIALTALLALMVFSPVAQAGVSDTAEYEYKVTGFDYTATGHLSGAHLPSERCTPVEDSSWEGDVTTTEAELSTLTFGDGSLDIHSHGTTGELQAEMPVDSNFKASHTETTGCDSEGLVDTTFSTQPCVEEDQSVLKLDVKIHGGVGTQVKLTWDFFIDDGDSLVPTGFTCIKPFRFAPGSAKNCLKSTRTASLDKFTARRVKIPFSCVYSTKTPPPGTNYTIYGSVVKAKGTLQLKRTKQH
jgi:hypothetical protein